MHKQDLTNALIQKENGSINIAIYYLTKVKFKKYLSQYNFMCCIPCTVFYSLSVLNHILDLLGLIWEREILIWLILSLLQSTRHLEYT